MRRVVYTRPWIPSHQLIFSLVRLAVAILSIPLQIAFAVLVGVTGGIAKGYKNDLRNRKSSTY
jgi:hypothetical protein